MFENLATAAGDEVNVDIASKVVQQLGQVCEEYLLYFLEIIKTNLDLVKNLCCSSRECYRLHAR